MEEGSRTGAGEVKKSFAWRAAIMRGPIAGRGLLRLKESNWRDLRQSGEHSDACWLVVGSREHCRSYSRTGILAESSIIKLRMVNI